VFFGFWLADSPRLYLQTVYHSPLKCVQKLVHLVCFSRSDPWTVWAYNCGQSAIVVYESRTSCRISYARGGQSDPLSRIVWHSSRGQSVPLPRIVCNYAESFSCSSSLGFVSIASQAFSCVPNTSHEVSSYWLAHVSLASYMHSLLGLIALTEDQSFKRNLRLLFTPSGRRFWSFTIAPSLRIVLPISWSLW
jgi:hypothetical protein